MCYVCSVRTIKGSKNVRSHDYISIKNTLCKSVSIKEGKGREKDTDSKWVTIYCVGLYFFIHFSQVLIL